MGSNGVTVTKFLQLLMILVLYQELSYFLSQIFTTRPFSKETSPTLTANRFSNQSEDCNTERQFLRFVNISSKFSYLDEIEMVEETGCLRHCQRLEYRLSEKTPLGYISGYPPEKLKISFIVSTGKIQSFPSHQ